MNIFATSPDPVASAIALDDKRVVKMVLESAQLLSTAIHLRHGTFADRVYKPTHPKHPCTLWAFESRGNWQWLHHHMVALSDEYSFRFERVHKSTELFDVLYEGLEACEPDGEFTLPPNCAAADKLGINFKHINDVYSAYRMYLNARWEQDKRTPVWTKRQPPEWCSFSV